MTRRATALPARRRLAGALGLSAAWAAGVAWAVLGASGCAGLLGPPDRITLGPDELARLLDRQFPQERRVLEVLDVTLRSPQVRLKPAQNRLAADLEIGVRERLLGGRWNGTLAFDSALRWEVRDRTLRLDQPRVSDLRLVSAGGDVRTPAERLGAALVERVLDGLVLYTLPAERAESLRAAGVVPSGVAVTARGVEITLSPAAR